MFKSNKYLKLGLHLEYFTPKLEFLFFILDLK